MRPIDRHAIETIGRHQGCNFTALTTEMYWQRVIREGRGNPAFLFAEQLVLTMVTSRDCLHGSDVERTLMRSMREA
jgi:hypothetical protein